MFDEGSKVGNRTVVLGLEVIGIPEYKLLNSHSLTCIPLQLLWGYLFLYDSSHNDGRYVSGGILTNCSPSCSSLYNY
jgi:hypothetical protein